MGNIKSKIISAGAAASAFVGWLDGGWDNYLRALLILVVIDYLSFVVRDISNGRLSSDSRIRGICKKVFIFVIVGVGHTVDMYLIGEGNVFRNVVIFFFISNEGISVLENAADIGLPIPAKLKDWLDSFVERK